MQGFGAQTHLFSEVTGPQQFERTKKKCPMDLRKLLTPFLLTPLQRDFETMRRKEAKKNTQKERKSSQGKKKEETGKLIFIPVQCWEVLPFLTIQRQRCMKILCPKGPAFLYTAGTRPLPVYLTTKMSVVRLFSVLSKDEIGP